MTCRLGRFQLSKNSPAGDGEGDKNTAGAINADRMTSPPFFQDGLVRTGGYFLSPAPRKKAAAHFPRRHFSLAAGGIFSALTSSILCTERSFFSHSLS